MAGAVQALIRALGPRFAKRAAGSALVAIVAIVGIMSLFYVYDPEPRDPGASAAWAADNMLNYLDATWAQTVGNPFEELWEGQLGRFYQGEAGKTAIIDVEAGRVLKQRLPVLVQVFVTVAIFAGVLARLLLSAKRSRFGSLST